MTLLTVWPEDDPDTVLVRTTDAEEIATELKEHGVRFDRWSLREDVTADNALEKYRAEVDRVIETEGYILVDAMEMTPADTDEYRAKAVEFRQKFLSEHTHDDDEDRYFARGAGVFYLHVGGKVYGVLCEAGDLLSVPANTTHWFDMGTTPDYVSIRFFHDDDGWVGNFTGSDIATKFPTFDQLMAGHRG
ncbi:acireductone dioxygenase [Lentzea sp. NBRC 105346]|uniref:1,2-dihydroxy-3-keto-5-methylthiopentene dioxygenase n=1 Tax=Lentzea sp. NBRC 105346 TaxID=3032205 RepID=UPI0024A22AA7|nr:cupin [Lentzea sp. NBRC 105346]GLZ31086.1 acireductone dioxygenase [Lentzea sp. NBRC 105346]